MLLKPYRVSTKRFTYNAVTNTFTAEASDLGSNFRLGRVYDDACDMGFTLMSARTGKEVVFYLSHTERDREGELLYDEFRAVPHQHVDAMTECAKVVIVND